MQAARCTPAAPGLQPRLQLDPGSVDSWEMALDLLVLAFLGVLAWLGARRGGEESGVRLIGLPVAYGCSYLAGLLAGPALAAALGGSSWLGALGAGLIGFLAVQALVEILARGARRRSEGQRISDASRLAGALCGVARGFLLVVPLLWLASFAEGAREAGVSPNLPDLSGARSTQITQALVAVGTEGLARSEDRGDRMTAHALAAPGESVAALNQIVSDPRMRVLQSDPGFWRDVENGNIADALARPTFLELTRDAQVRARLAKLGLIAPTSAVDAQQFQDEMALVMTAVGPKLRALRNDPALAELMADPEVRARIQSGDTLGLLGDPRVRALVARVAN